MRGISSLLRRLVRLESISRPVDTSNEPEADVSILTPDGQRLALDCVRQLTAASAKTDSQYPKYDSSNLPPAGSDRMFGASAETRELASRFVHICVENWKDDEDTAPPRLPNGLKELPQCREHPTDNGQNG